MTTLGFSAALSVLPRNGRMLSGVPYFLLSVIFGWVAGTSTVAAQTGAEREYEIKAAFLFKFFNYVDWPSERGRQNRDTVTIGILGENPFGSALEPLTVKTVKGKKLVIKQLAKLQEAEHCQLVFISASEKNKLPQILDALKQYAVLTVGEVDGFAQHGGIINLIADKNKVGLEINPDAAERARLTINPQLLKVAKLVKG